MKVTNFFRKDCQYAPLYALSSAVTVPVQNCFTTACTVQAPPLQHSWIRPCNHAAMMLQPENHQCLIPIFSKSNRFFIVAILPKSAYLRARLALFPDSSGTLPLTSLGMRLALGLATFFLIMLNGLLQLSSGFVQVAHSNVLL